MPIQSSSTDVLNEPSQDGLVVQRFDRNLSGRDFVVGDIHGMFEHLRRLLNGVEFDQARDRLFSVGDLVDRGPQSDEALDWLDKTWFHACRGNHEQFAIDSEDPEQLELWINHNGGQWWLELDEARQIEFRNRFRAMPLVMEVETVSGNVGIVHADVPPFINWDKFIELLEVNNHDAALYAMWSRNRITGAASTKPVGGGVDRVYCGHTPTRKTLRIDNVYFIDTGAAYVYEGYLDAHLTMVEIQPTRHKEFKISTRPKD